MGRDGMGVLRTVADTPAEEGSGSTLREVAMNRDQKAARRKERHDRSVANRLAKKRAIEHSSEEEEDIDLEAGDVVENLMPSAEEIAAAPVIDETGPEDDEDDETEPIPDDQPELVPTATQKSVKKDYYGDMPATPGMMPMMIGPTSWEEKDAEEAAEAQASAVRETTWDTQDLVRNILQHPMMDPAEKSKAIQAVGKGFQTRVDEAISKNSPDAVKKDLDLLALEAIIQTDRRHMGLGERIGDFAKAVLSSAARENLPAGEFALVVTRNGKKIKKYPIHDKAHVRNALARAAQQIKAGGQGAADARAALPKIRAAAKRMGIGASKEKDASGIFIEKDANGDWRWVGLVSNNFIDWQGDIISKEAHQEYVAFLDANPDAAPLFMSWHTPGTERKNPVDYWNFDNGFLIMSGKLDETEAASLLKAKASTDIGMSLQGVGLRDPDDPRVVKQYRLVEVSDLPLEDAANPFTDFSVMVKEVDMDKKKYLAALLGSDEKANAFMAKTGMKQEALEAAGIEQKAKAKAKPGLDAQAIVDAVKEVAGDDVEVDVQEVEEEAEEAPVAKSKIPDLSQEMVDRLAKEFHLDDLSEFVTEAKEALEKVPLLEGVIKQMQDGSDKKLAEAISPPAARFAWARKARASESDDTVLGDDDELANAAPEVPWLSEATNTKPIPVQ